jgi:hypothetical protein
MSFICVYLSYIAFPLQCTFPLSHQFLTVREGFTCLLQAQKAHGCLYLFIIQILLNLLWDAD